MKKKLEMGIFVRYPHVLTVREVQIALRIGRAGVYKLLASGELTGFKLGNTYKIPKNALFAYMNRQTRISLRGGKQK